MAYNTGNAIGSTDVRDLYDNAQALDRAMNSQDQTWTDRLGNSRPTISAVGAVAEAFKGAWLGAKSADPTTDNDGNPLQIGAEYYNTTTGYKRTYGNSGWYTPNVDGQALGQTGAGQGAEMVGAKQAGTGAIDRTQKQLNLEIVRVSDYGDVTASEAAANAAWDLARAAISGAGCIINPKGSLVNFASVTVPNAVMVIDMQDGRIIASDVGAGKSVGAGGLHYLFKDVRNNQGTRIHVEPRGFVSGVASKFDLMFDDYDSDIANYRIFNFYCKTYDPADASTTQGNNGVAVLGAKGIGRNFGIWPTIHFGFSDDGAGAAVPMKMYYHDTSDTEWRTPMKGMWYSGASVASGDYMLSANKLYKSGTTGTTGATAPTHSSGTVSDGAVDWEFIRDFAAVAANIKGCVVFGDRDDMPKFGLPNVRVQWAKGSATWNGIRHSFLDQNGAIAWNIYTNTATDDLHIESADGTRRFRFDQTGQFVQITGLAILYPGVAATGGDTTPSIKGISALVFNNGSPTSITAFDDGLGGQEFTVESSNTGYTTIVNGANIVTASGADIPMTANMVLKFRMNGAGTVARQIG